MRLLIVNFHYIRDVKPAAGIYPVSTAEFRAQVETLGRHFRFVSQPELLDMLASQSFPDAALCLLTFDDALAEQHAALDVLERLSVPAVCFATTDAVLRRRPHDVHKLHYVYARLSEGELFDLLEREHSVSRVPMDDAILAEEYRYDTPAMRRIKFFLNFVLDDAGRSAAVTALFAQVEPDEQKFTDALYMTRDDLLALARKGMLGTHTRTHRPLAPMPADDMRAEIAGSRDELQAATGLPIHAVSYPYGGPAAVSDRVAAVAREAGMRFGLTMIRGMNDVSDLAADGALLLKRVDTNDAPGGKLRSERYFP